MARPNLRPGRSCKTMEETMAVVDEPGTRVPRLYRRCECVKYGSKYVRASNVRYPDIHIIYAYALNRNAII